MSRFKLTIEYDGSGFVGWQRQDSGFGVQEAVETAVFKLSGEPAFVQGAGRTDSGVHALGQIAHVDIEKPFSAATVRDALNNHLRPYPVSILNVEDVSDDFHARYSATGRAYLYRILNRRPPPVLDEGQVWWVATPLDAKVMHEAAQELVGHHDFTTFRASECQAKSPVKTLNKLDVSRVGEEIHVACEARSFLHHQVRNFVGTLQIVGAGKWRARDVHDALMKKDRRAGGPTAPPEGLYLTRVTYDE